MVGRQQEYIVGRSGRGHHLPQVRIHLFGTADLRVPTARVANHIAVRQVGLTRS